MADETTMCVGAGCCLHHVPCVFTLLGEGGGFVGLDGPRLSPAEPSDGS